MKVILLQDLYKHGVAGQVVKVADGFARNYLIPRKMATPATKQALEQHQELLEQSEARRLEYEGMLNELGRKIDGTELVFGRLAAPTGKLFGSVTTQEIADALMEKTDVDINRRRISQQSLREIGVFEVPVRLGTDISPVLRIVIVREEELEDYLAAREAGEEPEIETVVDVDSAEAVAEELEAVAEAVEEAGDDLLEEVVEEVAEEIDT